MKTLSKGQLKKLVNTKYDMLLSKFPGHTRAQLRTWQSEEKDKLKKINGNDTEKLLKADRVIQKTQDEVKLTSNKYKILLDKYEQLEAVNEALVMLNYPINVKSIKAGGVNPNEEAVTFIVASDWHYEEEVLSDTVNGLNEMNLSIANYRIENFWKNALKLHKGVLRDNDIKTIVLALLGDFISGNIHDENMETALLLPTKALFAVERKLISGIQFLLENTTTKIIVHCVSGNHTRITKRIRHATFTGNSLEDIMYHHMAMHFEKEPRISFNIPLGYLSYMNVLGLDIRFHHGHDIRYGGGIGGIYIPANKAISQWNKGKRVDLDVFGHWHQLKDGGNFLINGSLIGYNPFALAIKADFEEPRQLFFVVNQYGRTGYNKIVVK